MVEETLALLEGLSVILLNSHNILQVTQLYFVTLARQFLLAIQGDCDGTHRYIGGLEVQELSLDKSNVEEEAGVYKNARLANVDCSAVIFKECLRWSAVNVKFNRF